MHLSWIVADMAELLAAGLAVLYCLRGARLHRAVQARWQDPARYYPDLDLELDVIWQRYRR